MLRAVSTFTRLQPLLSRQASPLRAMASWQAASGLSGTVTDQLKDPSLFRTQAFVAGTWVNTESTFEVLDPASGSLVATVAACGAREVDQAVAAADVAQKEWAKKTGKERGLVLKAWYDLMVANADDLAFLLTLEAGKPLLEARGEVMYAASFLEWFGEEAKRAYGDTIPATAPGRRLLSTKQPVGVAAMITPWNFPSAMITRKVGPCFAAGCSAVVKPAEATPLSALALAELGCRAGVPAGLLSILPAPRSSSAALGEQLCKHPVVRKVSFTGSTQVGVTLARWCAEGMKRTSFELGGNAPFIVFEDADIDVAVAAAMASKFRNAGQTCVCADRFLVHATVHDEFVAKLVAKVKALSVGHGLVDGIKIGPLINEAGVSKVKSQVEDAVSKGAQIVCGGSDGEGAGSGSSSGSGGGHFYSPTVLTGCTSAMQCFSEETFGPLVPVFAFQSEEEAIALANQADVGLAGYFCSKDLGRVWRVAEALEVGMVGVNEGAISTEVAPFGGVKMSGLGREGGHQGMDEYLDIKYICMGGI